VHSMLSDIRAGESKIVEVSLVLTGEEHNVKLG